ncbi:arylsulfatase [Burkholderia pyrrocinia]|uniref:arylsulfatase n=1 Tax=Burkholderia pyrrocinia TaxID=60550 RepID=UPI00157537B3|nr:arylsulfatase [Burkholderia pyrrocinia]NTX28535.1 arylsulfatase [Burkholderia pyrrocinia]
MQYNGQEFKSRFVYREDPKMKDRFASTILAMSVQAMLALAVPVSTAAQPNPGPTASGSILPMPEVESAGVIGRTFKDSTPPKRQWLKPAAGAPNVVVVLLDDVGFGAAGTFGGLIPTPALDKLAQGGLRYNRFHTTAMCSPTRASLLTGRNPHAVGWGVVSELSTNYDGYIGIIPQSAATVAEILRQHGYATSAWGKWHNTAVWETSVNGPFDHWPTGQGFQKFYGFLGGEIDQYEPELFDNTTLVQHSDKPGYYLNEDLTDHAIAWMQQQKSVSPDKPFFVYFAPGGTHAPLQVPKGWIDRFKGKFDQGWDKVREQIFARQKSLGVIPADAVLTPRPQALPSWDSQSPDEKKVEARLMETYAGYLANTDAQVGRLVTALQQMQQFDNTLFIYVVGDNGASGEGGLHGHFNEMDAFNGIREDAASTVEHLDEIGGPTSSPHYPAEWAWAMNTPFQWMKQVASHFGGTRNPMVISWPAAIREPGGLRSQFAYVADLMPTILEATRIPVPKEVNGVVQQPVDGSSLVYSFNAPDAPSLDRAQYFEMVGNRAMYRDGWMVSTTPARMPWNVLSWGPSALGTEHWELYHVDGDFTQAHDVAQQYPDKLRELQDLFWKEARKNNVLPLDDRFVERLSLTNDVNQATARPSLTAGRTHFVYYQGAVGINESSAPNIKNRSYAITVKAHIPDTGGEGVLVAQGGAHAGWSLFVNHSGDPVYTYVFAGERVTLTAPARLPVGDAIIRFEFTYDGGGRGKGGTGRLIVNGQLAGEARLERTVPNIFSMNESFDVGTDTKSPVGDYPRNYRFNSAIHSVAVDLL